MNWSYFDEERTIMFLLILLMSDAAYFNLQSMKCEFIFEILECGVCVWKSVLGGGVSRRSFAVTKGKTGK